MIPAPEQHRFPMGGSRVVWDSIIGRYGELALLRQSGLPDRWVMAIIGQFNSMERLGGVSNPLDRKAIVSCISPTTGIEVTPAPSEKDVFVRVLLDDNGAPVTSNGVPQTKELMKIVAPPDPIGTNQKQLYWRLQVRA